MSLKSVAVGAGLGSGFTLALLRQYLRNELQSPLLINGLNDEGGLDDEDHEDRQKLLQEIQLMLKDYWPHPLIEFSGYISTTWTGFWASLPAHNVPGTVEPLVLKDGGTVSLHWGKKPEFPDRLQVVLVLPGLNNDSRTSFVQNTMRYFRDAGFQAVALNYRGVGGLDITSPKFGCADSWQDIPEVVQHIERTMPGAELTVIGFSMGAGILLRHLGEEGPRARYKAAVAIAAPVDFSAVGASLESSFRKRLMNFAMVSGVKLFMMRSFLKSAFREKIAISRVLRATTLRQLEEASICPLHGYADGWDYYSKNNPRSLLQQISVPTLVVNAKDDPVISIKTLPVEDMRRNPHLYTLITRRGGHIAWSSGGSGNAAWTDQMAVRFLKACSPRSRL